METVIDINECPICMDRKESPLKTLTCCQHTICEACYTKLPQRECPFCRQQLTPSRSASCCQSIETTTLTVSLPPRNIMCMYGGCGCCVCFIMVILFFCLMLFGSRAFYSSGGM
jgi:hypothetical protein